MIEIRNVITLSDLSKLAQVAREMVIYKLEILALAKTRWVGSEDEQLQSGDHFMLSGNNAERVNDVGIIISKICRKRFNPILVRTITAQFYCLCQTAYSAFEGQYIHTYIFGTTPLYRVRPSYSFSKLWSV